MLDARWTDFIGEALVLCGFPHEVEPAALQAALGQLVVQRLAQLGYYERRLLTLDPWELAPSR